MNERKREEEKGEEEKGEKEKERSGRGSESCQTSPEFNQTKR